MEWVHLTRPWLLRVHPPGHTPPPFRISLTHALQRAMVWLSTEEHLMSREGWRKAECRVGIGLRVCVFRPSAAWLLSTAHAHPILPAQRLTRTVT
jgi:hypothetical protein